jgi:N-acetylneuraminate synthase
MIHRVTGDPIRAGDRLIGPGQPCFVIAEAGVNHNGDVELGKRLVDAAAEAGADAVKFQTWVTELIITHDSPTAAYQKRNLGGEQSQFDMLKRLELGYDAFRELDRYAREVGILFLSTADEEQSADFLEALGVPLFKIGSAEVTTLPFLRHVGAKGLPIILSTGMAELAEVETAVREIEATGNHQLVLLHCVSTYPVERAAANLRVMDALASLGYPVGYSDHTMGIDVAVAAAARGACVVEKHLTLDRTMPGPDHVASIEPHELHALVESIRHVEEALGDGVKAITPEEANSRQVMQKVLVARRSIAAGERIDAADLALKRSTGGLGAPEIDRIVGRVAARDLREGAAVTLDAVA